jgi:hypothetical protein
MDRSELVSLVNTTLLLTALVFGAFFAWRFYKEYTIRAEREIARREISDRSAAAAAEASLYHARAAAEERERIAKEAAEERERNARELALEREYQLAQMVRDRELAEEKARNEGGFQFFEVTETQKRAFTDAFNGFKEYAELKGYNVVVLVDSARQGLVGLKITITDVGATVSTTQVRRDVNEYIRKMAEQNDLSDMPMVTDPVEHARLVAAICTRFGFLRHQAEMSATTAQAYRAMIATIGHQGLGAVGYLPAPASPPITIQITNDGGRLMSGNNSASNSPGAAVGAGNTAGITGSVVIVGATESEREAQTSAIDALIERIKASGLAPEQKEEAARNLSNVKEEVTENETPDQGRIARWLSRAQQITQLGTAGAELFEKGEELYRQFGSTG